MSTTNIFYFLRHGHRSPLKNFANLTWNGELGVLTHQGRYECYMLGTKLRNQLGNYIQDTGANVTVTSSGIDRTAESAYQFMRGMYFKQDYQQFKNQYRIQNSFENELIFRGYSYKIHPSLYKIYMELKSQCVLSIKPIIDSISEEVKELYEFDRMDDYLDMYYLFDHLNIIINNGGKLRWEDEKKVYTVLSKFIYYFMYFDNMYIHPTVRKLTTHFMFKKIQEQISSTNGQFHLYSLHDANLLCVLIALGFNPKHVPTFASSLSLMQYPDRFKAVYHSPIYGKPYIKEYKYKEMLAILQNGCFQSAKELYSASGNTIFCSK